MQLDEFVLPIHPRSGLQAVGLRRNGAPIWPVLGGAPEDEDEEAQKLLADALAGDDANLTDEQKAAKAKEALDALGDPGKQAIDRMKAKWQKERDDRKARDAQLATLNAEIAKLKAEQAAGGGTGAAGDDTAEARRKAYEDAVAAAKAEAARDASSKANERIVKAEVKAAAAGKLANPALAIKLLDLSKIEVDADGNVDADEVAELIDDLVKKEPYLAAQGRKFQGSADGGQQTGGGSKLRQLTADDVKRMTPEQIVEAQKKGQLDDYLAS